jgi:hypothetical protein
MITYSWKITALDTSLYPFDEKSQVVFTIYATYTGTEIKDSTDQPDQLPKTYLSNINLTQNLIFNNEAPFTPYADLTEEQVLGWLLDLLPQQKIDEMQVTIGKEIADQIYADYKPFCMQQTLPWSN